jgi:polyhydroxybutyrate depolymerase
VRKLLVVIAGVGLVAGACASNGSTAATKTSSTTAATIAIDPVKVAAAPSAGCSGTEQAVASGETKQTLTLDGEERWWFRRVPPTPSGFNAVRPSPLVMDLHGYSEGAAIHEQLSGMAKFGDAHGFATVTPQGQGPVARWDTTLGSADLVFLGKVLDTTEQQLCIDTNRVFVTGLSNGAFMTSAMACQYSVRIAAVAPVAGVRNIKGCAPKRAVPIVAFHGTADGYVDYEGGIGQKALDLPAPDGSGRKLRDTLTPDQLKTPKDTKNSIPNIMAAWAKRNGCAGGDTETKVAADVTKLTWDCAPADAAILYRVTGGGHAWPGSAASAGIVGIVGPTTMNIDANEIMWDFFVAHPLTTTK